MMIIENINLYMLDCFIIIIEITLYEKIYVYILFLFIQIVRLSVPFYPHSECNYFNSICNKANSLVFKSLQ